MSKEKNMRQKIATWAHERQEIAALRIQNFLFYGKSVLSIVKVASLGTGLNFAIAFKLISSESIPLKN